MRHSIDYTSGFSNFLKVFVIFANLGIIFNSLIPGYYRHLNGENFLGSEPNLGIFLIISNITFLSNVRLIMSSSDLDK